MNTLQRALAAGLATGLLGATSAAAQTVAVVNGQLHLAGDADAPRTIEGGTVLMRDGRIVAVGTDVAVPDDAEIIDAAGRPVTPGLFAAPSSLGLVEISATRESNDSSTDDEGMYSASLQAVDGINAASTAIGVARRGGITRALTLLSPGASLFSGCGALLVLDESVDPVTEDCAAQHVVLGYAGAARTGDNRAAALARVRRAFDDALDHAADPAGYRRIDAADRLRPVEAAALVPIVRGEVPVLVTVHSASDILRVLDLADSYGLDIALLGASEAHLVADDIADAGVPVIVDPIANLPGRFEQIGATLAGPALLEEAGVEVLIGSGGTHDVRRLPQMAGNAVANGMSFESALEAITLAPARFAGVADDLGSLSVGKIGDVVVWSGDPLEVTSRPDHVVVDGAVASINDRPSALAERYRDLSRDRLPISYGGSDRAGGDD